MTNSNNFRINNFDLIRLFASSQVAVLHSFHYMGAEITGLAKELLFLLHIFPGVPVFFFVSGYLISRSYESNSNLAEYASNRILRLYPGLILAVSLSFILIAVSGYMSKSGASFWDWMLLYIAKISVFQFYNPDFMRLYGDGVLNGSLWTITVEIQFYILTPIVYLLLRKSKNTNVQLIFLIICFFVANRIFDYLSEDYRNEFFYKLTSVSFIPWFYMFLTGIFFQRNFDFFYKILSGKFVYILLIYLLIGYFGSRHNANFGNNLNPLFFVVLVPLVFSCAYSSPELARKVTHGNDLSYGIYIYHMPIINFFITLQLSGNAWWSILALVFTAFIAASSWFYIEKPCLKLKNHPFNPMSSTSRKNQPSNI